MRKILDYKAILWDFDGVLMDSMQVRDLGFIQTLDSYPEDQVSELLQYHRENGGLSRYVKFRYFFEKIRKEPVTEDVVMDFANKFSKIMISNLINDKLLIMDSLNFVKKYYESIDMYIVSGSDGAELNQICKSLDILKYFKSVHGSPTPKNKLVANILNEHNYNTSEVILIGDSINDFDAAVANNIDFCGYNNIQLKNKMYYLNNFEF